MPTVYVVGLDPFNEHTHLEPLREDGVDFRPLLRERQVRQPTMPVLESLRLARERLAGQTEPPDGVIAHWDFPFTLLAAMLRDEHELPGPTARATFACEHKLWSRRIQQRAAPDAVPAFDAIDPFADEPLDACSVEFPFWMKPIKAYSSRLGFLVNDREHFRELLPRIRREILGLAEPFNRLLDADDPEDRPQPDGRFLIVESLIGGRQFTVEGFVRRGETHIYGVIDSLLYPETSSFERYQYPSTLPDRVRDRAASVAARVMPETGFDGGCFNIEFFWDEDSDDLHIVEINPRLSQAHCNLFQKVDGASHHRVAARLALDRDPERQPRAGRFGAAAKFMLRAFVRDGVVRRTPSSDDIASLRRDHPEVIVRPMVAQGDWLSDHRVQDSYSYLLADVYAGGDRVEDLDDLRAEVAGRLGFDIDERPRPGREDDE